MVHPTRSPSSRDKRPLFSVAALSCLMLVGCATSMPAASPSASDTQEPASTPASQTPSATPTQSAAEEEWVSYSMYRDAATFEVPSTWSVELEVPPYILDGVESEPPAGEPWQSTAHIFDPEGIERLTIITVIGGHGLCDVGAEPADTQAVNVTVIDEVELDAQGLYEDPASRASLVFGFVETPEESGAALFTYRDAASLVEPQCTLDSTILAGPGDGTSVSTFGAFQFYAPAHDLISVASVEEAEAYAETPEYETLKQIALSVVYAEG